LSIVARHVVLSPFKCYPFVQKISTYARLSFMKAIILSAGQGTRLLPYTEDKPKCLLEIMGRPILGWQLEVLLSQDIRQITVVTGFGHEKVEGYIRKNYASSGVKALYNPEYATSDNLVSCWHSAPEMDGDFILLNGDTLFEPAVLKRLLAEAEGDINLTISIKDQYDADDMKVIFEGKRLRRVGKDLPLSQVNGESIGLSLYRDRGPELFKEALKEAISSPESRGRWYLSVIDALARQGLVNVVSIAGLSWCEIDFPKDLDSAMPVVHTISQELDLKP